MSSLGSGFRVLGLGSWVSAVTGKGLSRVDGGNRHEMHEAIAGCHPVAVSIILIHPGYGNRT